MDVAERNPASIGQLNPAPRSNEQNRIQVFFQLVDLAADRGRGFLKTMRGCVHAAKLRHDAEYAHIIPIHSLSQNNALRFTHACHLSHFNA